MKTLIESERPLFLREVAAGVGMASSNVYRYLVSFGQAGMIAQDPVSGRYDLGPLAIQLGLSALRRVDAIDIAIESLSRLVQATGTDGHVCVWGSAGPTILRWRGGPGDIAVKVSEGHVFPLFTSATGRTWAAFLPRDRIADRLDEEASSLVGVSGLKKTVLLDRLDGQLKQIRETGISHSTGERRSGIDALCAPILDRDGAIVSSITLLGISAKLDSRLDGAPVTNLRLAVEEVSRRLGAGELVIARYPWNVKTATAAPKRAPNRPQASA